MRKHLELSQCMSQTLTKARSSATQEAIRKEFDGVTSRLKENVDLLDDAARIFNGDGTAFSLSPKENKVIVRKGEKADNNFLNNNKKEFIATLIMVNATGNLSSPMLMFKYERIQFYVSKYVPAIWSLE